MSKTVSAREKATLIVDFDTWKHLNRIKNELNLNSIDETIRFLIGEHDSTYESWRNYKLGD
ncbi:MAG: hypothetical protein KIH08_12950 [Candidatus Freyarchaeota archaeon]|nr:hypothetical protein [Candidatus Jordarchaeia archaeon]MBS7268051.1 hypothetical protein [Candidatus Jordarchaeia archaeon]MBS7278926.1 hypothetical protein [Candidatus Jordarchaeia archaeon]